jgi:hypothetical protein
VIAESAQSLPRRSSLAPAYARYIPYSFNKMVKKDKKSTNAGQKKRSRETETEKVDNPSSSVGSTSTRPTRSMPPPKPRGGQMQTADRLLSTEMSSSSSAETDRPSPSLGTTSLAFSIPSARPQSRHSEDMNDDDETRELEEHGAVDGLEEDYVGNESEEDEDDDIPGLYRGIYGMYTRPYVRGEYCEDSYEDDDHYYDDYDDNDDYDDYDDYDDTDSHSGMFGYDGYNPWQGYAGLRNTSAGLNHSAARTPIITLAERNSVLASLKCGTKPKKIVSKVNLRRRMTPAVTASSQELTVETIRTICMYADYKEQQLTKKPRTDVS